MNEIRFFARDPAAYPFLSNFFPAPVRWHGLAWPTAEHLYQALKTVDPAEQERIRRAVTPGAAKRAARAVILRPDWETFKIDAMGLVLHLKFQQYPRLATWLRDTGSTLLIEDSPFDRFWGAGRDGTGQNMLGALLMELRERLASNPNGEVR